MYTWVLLDLKQLDLEEGGLNPVKVETCEVLLSPLTATSASLLAECGDVSTACANIGISGMFYYKLVLVSNILHNQCPLIITF